MTTLTITAKGQITLNKALLRKMGVGPGDRLQVEFTSDGGFTARPARPSGRRSIEDLIGSLKRPGQTPLSIEQMNEVIARAWAGERD